MSSIPEIPKQEDYKNLTLFDLTLIQKFPFIEEDFDGINMYGILSKIKDYLNDVIANEQSVTINQERVFTAFSELHNYVETYFTNLDVQEEINNKLDEMVEDGTLTNILMNYANVERIYNTTVEMIADSSNLHNNQKIKTLGYYNRNDGGGAEFVITNTEDTNEFQIVVGNLYATLIVKNYINPVQMGVQDNVATNLLTKASQIAQLHKVPLSLSRITYLVNESVPLFNGCEIDGHGATIRCDSNLPVLFASTPVANLNIHDLSIRCSNDETHENSMGILAPAYYSKFTNLNIQYGFDSIKISENASGTLVENYYENIICRSPRHNGLFLGSADNNKVTDGYIKNCIVNGATNSNAGIYIGSMAGYVIDGFHAYGGLTSAIVGLNGFKTNISNIYSEGSTSYAINCPRMQTNCNFTNMIIHHSNADNPCIRFTRSTYHPNSNSDVTISNTSIIRTESNTALAISSTSMTTKLSNVQLNATNQKLEDYVSGCVFDLKGTITNNNLTLKTSNNADVDGLVRITHRQTLTNKTQIEIPLPNITRWRQSLVSIKCFGAVYNNQNGKYYKADMYLFANDSDTTTVKVFNEENTMFTSITPTFDVVNRKLVLDFEFNASNVNAIIEYESDI